VIIGRSYRPGRGEGKEKAGNHAFFEYQQQKASLLSALAMAVTILAERDFLLLLVHVKKVFLSS
jgi:hypothetical protein